MCHGPFWAADHAGHLLPASTWSAERDRRDLPGSRPQVCDAGDLGDDDRPTATGGRTAGYHGLAERRRTGDPRRSVPTGSPATSRTGGDGGPRPRRSQRARTAAGGSPAGAHRCRHPDRVSRSVRRHKPRLATARAPRLAMPQHALGTLGGHAIRHGNTAPYGEPPHTLGLPVRTGTGFNDAGRNRRAGPRQRGRNPESHRTVACLGTAANHTRAGRVCLALRSARADCGARHGSPKADRS